MIFDLLKAHVVKNRVTGCIFHDLCGIMKSQQQRSESLWPDGSQTICALRTDLGVLLLGNSFNEHQLSMSSKILDAQDGTFSNIGRLILQALIEEWQKILGLQVCVEVISSFKFAFPF